MNGNELLVLLAGHTLRGLFVVSLAFAAAALSENSAAAAVVTLGVTLGGWALDFVAQVQGGMAQRLARFTPESALRVFEQGEWSSAVIGVSCAIALSLLGITSVALRAGQTRQRRVRRGASVAIVGLVAVMLTSQWRATADVSEDQRNSFAPDDVRALSAVRGTILIEAHLAPEDPRLVDLQRGVIHKLERIVDVKFTTSSRTSTGMFERSADGYGEVWYGWNGARRMSRSTTAPIVLETLYDLTGTPKPPHTLDLAYPGYPLSAQPRYAAMLFYFAWPICVIGLLVARSWSTARSRAPR